MIVMAATKTNNRAQAGRIGAVTIATNMAGRGTDIVLGGNVDYLLDRRLLRPHRPGQRRG